MKCREVRETFSGRLDGGAIAGRAPEIDAHLARCPECAGQWRAFCASFACLSELRDVRPADGLEHEILGGLSRVRAVSRSPEAHRPEQGPFRAFVASPAGALFCAVLLLAGAVTGFLAGRRGAPDRLLEGAVEQNGVVFLPGRTDGSPGYAVVKLDDRERAIRRSRAPQRYAGKTFRPERGRDELFLGGNEGLEVYLAPFDDVDPRENRPAVPASHARNY